MTEDFDVHEKNSQLQNTVFVGSDAKLNKKDAADDFLKSLEEVLGGSEKNAREKPDSTIMTDSENKTCPEPRSKFGDDLDGLDDLEISENWLDDKDAIEKADLDNDELLDDILSADNSLQTHLQNFIAGIKKLSTLKRRIFVSAVKAILLIGMVILFFMFFSGTDQKKAADIFNDSVSDSEIKLSGNTLFIENYEMKTFVIPMQDSVRDTVFFKVDFMIIINKIDLIQLKNNSVKIREAVYNQFYNKNSEIILMKLKRSEQLYKLKNVLNLIFKKEAIKDIEIVNYKLV